MNIRDVAGVDTPQELYEIASKHGIHVGSMDSLIRFAIELQKMERDEHASFSDNAPPISNYLVREPE